MGEYQITCVIWSDDEKSNEQITHVGNQADKWLLSKEAVIHHIESNTHKFYTMEAKTRNKNYVGIVKELKKSAYLRTHADNKWNDNLLTQPECGDDCKFLA
jgi:hypothetical protein